MNQYKCVKGITGFLIFDATGIPYFRIYDKKDKSKFNDYEIRLHDMEITILDDDAYMYINNADLDEDNYINYSKETLGNE